MRLPNGETEYVRTPMPKEALLHPQDEDYPVESDPHDIDRTYLRTTIGARLPRGWIILSSCRVDWGVPGIEPHGPDISVLKGLRGRRKNWKTFYVAREKAKPVAAIEITSSSTRVNDLKTKVDEYYRAGVPLYAIVDARERSKVRELQIVGYQSGKSRYEKMDLDARGRLLLEPLGIWLGAEGGQVSCWDAGTGERLEDYDGLLLDRERERRARSVAEEETRRLREEIRRLRGQS
jgi:Uma2 family endonuclease